MIVAAGGGTRNRQWMQIKADVSGRRLAISPVAEATVLGAALLAGIGSGIYRDASDALNALDQQPTEIFRPDERRHQRYRRLYEQGYVPLQEPLRQVYRQLAGAA
jgi:xylulokinase